jgi:hypothetical protein
VGVGVGGKSSSGRPNCCFRVVGSASEQLELEKTVGERSELDPKITSNFRFVPTDAPTSQTRFSPFPSLLALFLHSIVSVS